MSDFTLLSDKVSRCEDCGLLVAVAVEVHECNPVNVAKKREREAFLHA